jgi:hypothetical protein
MNVTSSVPTTTHCTTDMSVLLVIGSIRFGRFSWFEFSCGHVGLPRPKLNIDFGPVISEKHKRCPLRTAFGIWYASAGKGTSLHVLVQSEPNRVHPDGEGNDDTLGGSDQVPILLPIRTKYLDVSQRLQSRTQGIRDVRMRGQAFEVVEHLPIDAGL